MNPKQRLPRLIANLLIGVLLAACGGGGGGNGNGGPAEPPPAPPVPPIYTTPTAVRVSRATPFAAGCLALPAGARAYVNAEVEPHLAIDPTNPNHLVAGWQQDRLSDGGARGLVSAVSVDGGVTWSDPVALPFSQCAGGNYERVSDPWIGISDAASFYISIAFTRGARSTVLVSRSVDGGFTWGAPVALADDDATLYFNDKESLTVDLNNSRYVYAVWDRVDNSNDRGPTRFARSQDGGLSWEPAVTIHDPGAGRQTIGNVIVVAPDGTVHDFFTELADVPGSPGQVTAQVRVMTSSDHGTTWSAPTTIGDLRTVGTRDPSRPGVTVRAGEILGTFAVDPVNGTLHAVWQDSRFSGGTHDAIVISTSHDGGATWSDPARVNADSTVPAFTPTLAILEDGTIGVLYYDFRTRATPDIRPTDLWLAVSSDGVTWRETRLAGNFDLLSAPNAGGLFVGDYEGLVGHDDTFVSLYARVNNSDITNRTDVFADRTDPGALVATLMSHAGDTSRKTTALAWDEAAQGRVERHLAEARNQRRHLWREQLGAYQDSPND